jgi:class 3 adenylate cyclase/DNA-binding SARP family transcriptional activator
MSSADSPVLKAILFADLAQYSRLTAAGEDAALELVTRCFDLFREHCREWRGEFIKSTGDGVLVIFDSVSDALASALGVQARLSEIAADNPAAGRFRIGLHIGEVRRRASDVYGHAVNLAARVEAIAAPGGVCATREVYEAARGAAHFAFRFAGRHALKNMPETVPLYHVTRLEPSQLQNRTGQLAIAVIDGLAVLDRDGEPVDVRSRSAQALIGYLSLIPRLRALKGRIATLLWSERAPAEARVALNNCLRIVGKVLAEGLDSAGLQRGSFISLDPARVVIDIQRILSDLEEGKIDDALMQRPDWPDAILYGFDSVSTLYGAWLRVTRHNRRDHALELLEHLVDRFDSREPVVRRAATALLALEPSHEGAVRALMRHYAVNDNVAAALRTYEALRSTLRQHYGLQPDTKTAALAASLSAPVQLPRPKRAAESRPPVIVVGAFAAAAESIAAQTSGFRAELITNLSKFRDLTIVDLQGQSDVSAADYVLTAECRPAGPDTRLFATLQEAAARRVVWSDTYRLSLEQWINVQRQLVGRIASNVEIYLSHDRLSRALQRLPEDLGVYDAWLRGEHLLLRWSAEAEDEAERLFEQAIAEDPNFAPAHASLASVYNSRQFIRPGLPRRPENQERALELARRASELDPLDARNLMVVAWSAAMVQRFEQAELYFELAAELNPNHPSVLVSASLGLAFMGRIDLARKLLDHATALTPLLPAYQWSHIAIIRFLSGDYAGAVEAADRSQNVIIDTPGWKAAALGKLERVEEREAALEQLVRAVNAAWAGPPNPSRENIIAWFLGAFPIRHDGDRQNLAGSLRS